MKASSTKLAQKPQAPVFQTVIQNAGANAKAATPSPKPQKQDKIFPESRATREDRGPRQMKTTLDSEMLFRLCAYLSL